MDFRKKYRLFLSGILILCLAGLGVLNYIQIRDRIPDSYIQTEGEARPDRVSPLVTEEVKADRLPLTHSLLTAIPFPINILGFSQ